MEQKAQFLSYKKLIVFGSQNSGKASFSKRLETDQFEENGGEGNKRGKKKK